MRLATLKNSPRGGPQDKHLIPLDGRSTERKLTLYVPQAEKAAQGIGWRGTKNNVQNSPVLYSINSYADFR